MKSRDFCYWLQGFFEIHESDGGVVAQLNTRQLVCIQNHLSMVFKHEIDPSMGPPAHQAALSAAHNPEAFFKDGWKTVLQEAWRKAEAFAHDKGGDMMFEDFVAALIAGGGGPAQPPKPGQGFSAIAKC